MKSHGSQTLRQLLGAPLLLTLATLAGCQGEGEVAADKIVIASGDDQLGDAGEVLPEALAVRVEGPRAVDFLGRKGPRQPVSGIPVTFSVETLASKKGPDKPVDSASPPENSGDDVVLAPAELGPFPALRLDPRETQGAATLFARKTVLTDAEGTARIWVKLGTRNGNFRVEAAIARRGEKVHFRTLVGAKRIIPEPESVVGAKATLGLKLSQLGTDAGQSLKPIRKRGVSYQVVGGPVGGLETTKIREKDKRSETDNDGVSEIEITLGDAPGIYTVLAEVDPVGDEEPLRGILLSIAAIDWLLVALKLAGGILLFVMGVRILGNGFLLATSPFLHLPTETWARNRFQGYLGGLAAGAVFESSSLVISHATNLANGGLITAVGALSLVLGANVGGTMLPQLLSLDLEILAAPLLALGMGLLLVPRRVGLAPWSFIFLGAGLTLIAWGLLKDATELASYSTRLQNEVLFGDVDYGMPVAIYTARFLTYFALGGLVAFVLRTSNLVVVIALLLTASGILRAPTTIALVLGANMGSAAMVFALSLHKRREAKRVALANLTAQTLGSILAVVLCLIPVGQTSAFIGLVEYVLPGRLFAMSGAAAQDSIVAAHTAFNLLAGLPFVFAPRILFGLVDRVLPAGATAQDVKPYHLDRNLIAVPTLALRQVTEETIYLTEVCRKTIAESFDSFRYNDLDLSDQVLRRQEIIAEMHRDIARYLVEVSENQLSRRDASRLEILQGTVSSLVRLGELGERLRDLTARRIEEKVPLEPEADRDLSEVYDLVMAQFANILSLLRQRDTKTEENAVKMVERLAKFSSRVESHTRQRLESAETPTKPVELYLQSLVYQEAFHLLFRVAGHLAHIAQCMRILSPDRI